MVHGGASMARTNNYLIQAQQAKALFASYDQEKLISKLNLNFDKDFLYVPMLSENYRIHRRSADICRKSDNGWIDANSFEEVMTLLDLVCDSREDRFLTGRWKNMTDFGLMFHRNLLEGKADPWADLFEKNSEGFRNACLALGGKPLNWGDISYAIELFDGLCILVQLRFGDDEFPASLRLLWDENALMYIKYETMYFSKGLLLQKIKEHL